ncbi:TonB-dependent receptor [Sphingomonas kyeonggiensis]|uniref:TonB-dependent receptor n=1 Tax=Sphingomonas kyeonggiensis TaxID=1268553 RepID=A0A7W7JXE3_9SPHN|nr:TonB-dependent receptor [Sphingomonas kyeonggiensis]MBB4837113.1 TonB-dependent receptor [Sphingomonas kyeonggiensis]
MRRTALFAGSALCAVLMATPALAQNTDSSNQNTAPQAEEPTPTDQIVVTGFRRAYADALNIKRESDQITDSISSDGLGRFPDLNVGEAVQRIPGVQINREADSRNATISLRGLPGSFARTTLNGGGFADPILGSATNTSSTPLGAFNSDIFTAITVIKSPSAANLAGGLSGNVDLRIAPALGRKQGGWAKASYEYNDLGDLGSPALSAGYNAHITDNFAVFGVVAYKDEKFRRDSISVNTWANRLGAIQVGNQQAAATNPTYQALIAQYPGGVYYPSQVRQFVRMNQGHLLTGAAGYEWQATDKIKFGATGFYTERNLDKGLNHLLYIDTSAGNNTNTALAATSAVAHFTSLGTPYVVQTSSGPRAYINQFSAENLQTYDSIRSEPAKQKTWAINPTIEFKDDQWRVTAQGTISRAQVLANQIELDIIQNPYRNLGTAGLNGITASIFTGGTSLQDAKFILNTPNASHIPTGGYPLPSAANQATQAGAQMPGATAGTQGDRFGVTGTNGQSWNALDAIQLDFERSFEGSFLSSVQAGLRYERNEYTSIGSRNTSLGANTGNVTPAMSVVNPYVSDFFGGTAGGYTQNWRDLNINQVLGAVTPVNTGPRTTANPNGLPGQFVYGSGGVFLTPYGLVNNYWDANYWNNNFTNSKKVMSAYLMGKFDTDIFGIHVRGNAGVRYETTDQRIDALDCRNCASALSTLAGPVNHSMSNRTYKDHYDYWLPSAMFAADLAKNLVLRGAYYKTYVRPQPRDTVPISFVQVPEVLTPAVDPVYTVTIGATSIKPYTSNSFDLSLEWYNRPGGAFAVAVYQKNVNGYIGPITDQNVLCPSDGRINGVDYGLGNLSIVGPNCVSSNQFIGAGGTLVKAIVRASGLTNQNPMRVRGVEVSVQQNLDFLPGFLKYLGGAANYTYTQIDGKDTAGNPITLPSVAKHNINLIGYYETKLFGLRMVFNHRGKYDLAAGNSFVGDARTVKARSQLDASASINISKNFSLSLDAFNLTNATRSEYENDPMLPRRIDYDGRTYTLTVRTNF